VTVPSLLILGTDAVLAASPATPVQLVHACLAVGYQAVIPASWGDELIAGRLLERLRDITAPVIQCSCPLVARRLEPHGASLAPSIVAVASPPVATAKYLRALYAPLRPYITYAGACAAADHETIDVWLNPDALASALAERGISPLAQPTEFDSILPPDRRRFFSDPGGVPSRLAMRELPDAVSIVEASSDDFAAEVAQLLLSGSRILIDAAPSQGCACSGVTGGIAAGVARATVKVAEPPRALGPVVDHSLPLVLEAVMAAPSFPDANTPIAARIHSHVSDSRPEHCPLMVLRCPTFARVTRWRSPLKRRMVRRSRWKRPPVYLRDPFVRCWAACRKAEATRGGSCRVRTLPADDPRLEASAPPGPSGPAGIRERATG
jgi:hypothetical protein